MRSVFPVALVVLYVIALGHLPIGYIVGTAVASLAVAGICRVALGSMLQPRPYPRDFLMASFAVSSTVFLGLTRMRWDLLVVVLATFAVALLWEARSRRT